MILSAVNKIVTAQQMRDLDRQASEQYGIPSIILMENAGRAVSRIAESILVESGGASALIVAGPGNNGGDGFVAARHLHNSGYQVKIAYYGDRARAKGDALTNIIIAEKMGLDIETNLPGERLRELIKSADILIDALLGTGIKGQVDLERAAIIEIMNESSFYGIPVIAVDIPSGLDADTGMFLGPVVQADITVTFAQPKIGLAIYPGRATAGELVVADIGIPREALLNSESKVSFLTLDSAINVIKPREAAAHKGTYGHVAVIAGSVGMTGAAALAAQGALRIGAGLVTLAVPASLNDILEVKLTEAMTIPVPENDCRAFGKKSLDKVLEILENRDAAVVGPGLGRHEDTIDFTLELISKLENPAVIDADALFAISNDLNVLKKCKASLVLTPHPGEMANLTGTSTMEVQSNRLEAARSFAAEYGITLVLKGAGTIVAAPDGEAFINTTGTPGMASGGVGDVLSGMIGGLIAQGFDVTEAACAAVYLHGLAGEKGVEKFGEAALVASDILDSLGVAMQDAWRKISKKE